jgi:hypothetical protein
MMFDPAGVSKKKELANIKKKSQANIKAWVLEILPDEVKKEVEVIVCREFQCGDPKCAPIDTAIQIMFKDSKRPPLQTGLPLECQEVTKEHVGRAVQSMLNPSQAQDEFDMISEQAQAEFESIMTDVFQRLEKLNFNDKMGVTQRMFVTIEDYERQQMQMQAQLLQRNANPAANLLLSFSQQNKPEEIQRLIDEEKIDPSEGNSVGQTPLHVACLWGNFEAASCLVKNNADVNKKNQLSGGTPLHITCSSPKPMDGRIACAKLLLSHGADPTLKDDRGMSALDCAAQEPELLQVLQSS